MRVFSDISTYFTICFLSILYYSSKADETFVWWTNLIDFLLSWFNNNKPLVFVLLFQITLETPYWLIVSLISFFDKVKYFQKFRIQAISNDPERLAREEKLTREAFIGTLLNHWIIRPVLLYFLYPVFESTFGGDLSIPLPSFRKIMLDLFLCMLIDDTWFYWMHRLFHHYPFLYKNVHKQHHLFVRPNIFATEYAHPVEDIVVNNFGTIIPPLLLRSHPFICMFYPALKLYQSMEAHSGYNIPFPLSITSVIDSMDCAPAHDFHHSHNVGNFGGWFMFWDWICGTDSKYKNYVTVKQATNQVFDTARRPYEHDYLWPSFQIREKST